MLDLKKNPIKSLGLSTSMSERDNIVLQQLTQRCNTFSNQNFLNALLAFDWRPIYSIPIVGNPQLISLRLLSMHSS